MSQCDVGTVLGSLNPTTCCIFPLGSVLQAPGSNPGGILFPVSNWISVERGAERNAPAAARGSIKSSRFSHSWEAGADFFSLLLELTLSLRIFWNNKHKLLVFLQRSDCIWNAFRGVFCRQMWAISLFIRAARAAWNLYFSQIGQKGFILEKRPSLHRYFFTRSLQVYLPSLLRSTNGIKPWNH